MAANWQFQVNNTPATGAVALYYLITAMIAAGWKKKADSDGSTYSSSGTQVTGGGSGANGLGNTDAWVRMQDPAGLREYTWQRGSDNQHWRMKYSWAAGFTGGSPGATQTPSASDQQILFGGGTDGSPSFTEWFFTADGGYRFNCAADANPFAVVIGATTYNVYRFFSFGIPTGGGSVTHGFAIDPLDPVLNAATFEYEADPVVHYIGTGSGNVFSSGLGQANNFKGWIFLANNSPTWASTLNTDYTSGFNVGNNIGVGPKSGNDFGGKPLFYQSSSIAWPKGYGSFIKQHETGTSGNARSTGNTLSVVTAGDTILVGETELPWNGSTPLI